MDVSDLRKRIIRALDDARKESAARRQVVDEAAAAYARFLRDVATPLFRQSATVLRAEGHPFSAHTPAGSLRLASDRSPQQDFIELELDASGSAPAVVGRVSAERGRTGIVVDEVPLSDGRAVADLTEDDVAKFLVAQIPKLITRTTG